MVHLSRCRIYRAKINESSDASVRAITGSTLYNLWHHCLCHAGKFSTDNIAKIADGVPSLQSYNPFFSCDDCTCGKFTNMIKCYNKNPDRATKQGYRFNLDYGFVRGDTIFKNEDGALLTSKDGYNCYLLIVDKYSRYMWVFLFANKSPPIKTIKNILCTYGLTTGLRQIQSDQG